MEHRIFKTEFAGRELSVEVGRYAEQATVIALCAAAIRRLWSM